MAGTIIATSVVCIIFSIVSFVKTNVTFNNRVKIRNAIEKYNDNLFIQRMNALRNNDLQHPSLTYSTISPGCMESFNMTNSRWNDWGYKNIVPAFVYSKIESYIEDNKKYKKE